MKLPLDKKIITAIYFISMILIIVLIIDNALNDENHKNYVEYLLMLGGSVGYYKYITGSSQKVVGAVEKN